MNSRDRSHYSICKGNSRSIILFSLQFLGNLRSIDQIIKGISDRSRVSLKCSYFWEFCDRSFQFAKEIADQSHYSLYNFWETCDQSIKLSKELVIGPKFHLNALTFGNFAIDRFNLQRK